MSLYPGRWMQVNLALVAGVTSVENFSTPLFITPDSAAPSTVTFYTSASSLPAGVGATLLGAVNAALAQRTKGPALNRFAVVKQLADVAQVDTIVIPATPGTGTYTYTQAGVTITVDSDPALTQTQLRDAYISQINADSTLGALVTAASSGNNVTITSDVAGTPFTGTVGGTASAAAAAVSISTTTANRSIATQLATWAVTPGWYAAIPVGAAAYAVSDLTISRLNAAVALLTRKIGMVQTAAAECVDAGDNTDPMSVAQAADYDTAFLLYEATDKPTVAGAAGRWLSYSFETALASPQRMELAGNTPDSSYGDAEVAAVTGKGGNIYPNVYGAGGAIADGRMASGVAARIIRGVHWLDNELEVRLFELFYKRANMGKPIVNVQADLEAIGGVIRSVLAQATRIGLFKTAPELGVPKSSELNADDVAAGTLTGFTFNGARADEFITMVLNGYIE